jgi:hypothetical protein
MYYTAKLKETDSTGLEKMENKWKSPSFLVEVFLEILSDSSYKLNMSLSNNYLGKT